MRKSHHRVAGENIVAIDVRPHDIVPRIAKGQIWQFGRRLEVLISQVITGGADDGEDLVYFGPVDGRGKTRFSVWLDALSFARAVFRYNGRLKTK